MELYTSTLGSKVIGCAIEVHSALGPGLLESMYQRCLAHELELQGIRFEQQVALPITYKGLQLGLGYRVDLVVEGELLIELKTTDRLLPVHTAQVLTYLRLLDLRQGFLLNFNVARMVEGIRSIMNSRTGRNHSSASSA
jgi:GxxExxY protein